MTDHYMKRRTKEFADKLLANPKMSATRAYIETHETNNPNAAKVEASRLLTKPNVKIYMQKHIDMAKRNIVKMASDPSIKPETRLKANQDILDRTEGKATIKTEVNSTNINLNVEASEELKDQFTEFLKQKTKH